MGVGMGMVMGGCGLVRVYRCGCGCGCGCVGVSYYCSTLRIATKDTHILISVHSRVRDPAQKPGAYITRSITYTWGCPEPYVYTVYDRKFGDFPAKNTVYTPYIYNSDQPYTYMNVQCD
jgi:hypothetical protein